jgi:nucleoside-diphosphate-sugar epimerase
MALKVAIVGRGRIGRHLAKAAFPAAPALFSGREAFAAKRLDDLLGDIDLVIHAAGPAGDAVSAMNPALAFALHYTLTDRLASWAFQSKHRRLILLGTLAPNEGFYGPLKRAAIARVQHLQVHYEMPEALHVIELGHVIGEGMSVHESPGVVARFIQAAVTSGTLRVPPPPGPAIRFTPLASLVETVIKLVAVPIEHPAVLSPVSPPIYLRDLAQNIVTLARTMYGKEADIVESAQVGQGASYADPTGVVLPIKPLSMTLMAWMRSGDVKLLFDAPRRRA